MNSRSIDKFLKCTERTCCYLLDEIVQSHKMTRRNVLFIFQRNLIPLQTTHVCSSGLLPNTSLQLYSVKNWKTQVNSFSDPLRLFLSDKIIANGIEVSCTKGSEKEAAVKPVLRVQHFCNENWCPKTGENGEHRKVNKARQWPFKTAVCH